MGDVNKFKLGDSVSYRNGMDFKDFNGIVEKCIDYKGAWHYMVKDLKDNTVKRAGEKYLSMSIEVQGMKSKSKFKVGDSVKYKDDRGMLQAAGVIERSINNYLGQWQYMVKDTKMNVLKRIDEKYLELSLVKA